MPELTKELLAALDAAHGAGAIIDENQMRQAIRAYAGSISDQGVGAYIAVDGKGIVFAGAIAGIPGTAEMFEEASRDRAAIYSVPKGRPIKLGSTWIEVMEPDWR